MCCSVFCITFEACEVRISDGGSHAPFIRYKQQNKFKKCSVFEINNFVIYSTKGTVESCLVAWPSQRNGNI